MLAAAKACLLATGSLSNCSLTSAYNQATATVSTSNGSTALTESQQLSTSSARLLLMQNLKACYSSNASDGTTRNSTEVELCAKNLSASVYNELESPLLKDFSIRSMQRKLAAERMYACMSQGTSSAICTAEAVNTQHKYSSANLSTADVMDGMILRQADYYNTVWSTCDKSNTTIISACMSSAGTARDKTGGEPKQQWMLTNLNALRQSSSWWCSCLRAGSNTTECERSSKEKYVALAGDESEWVMQDRDKAFALQEAYCTGDLTNVVKDGVIDHTTQFLADCDKLVKKDIAGEIKRKIMATDPSLAVRIELGPQSYTAGLCSFNAYVDTGNSIQTRSEIITQIGAIEITATTISQGGRRGVLTGIISAAEHVAECASSVRLFVLLQM